MMRLKEWDESISRAINQRGSKAFDRTAWGSFISRHLEKAKQYMMLARIEPDGTFSSYFQCDFFDDFCIAVTWI